MGRAAATEPRVAESQANSNLINDNRQFANLAELRLATIVTPPSKADQKILSYSNPFGS